MRAKFEERQAKNRIVLVERFPALETLQERVIVGLLSWTLMDRRERWVKASAAIHTEFGVQTPSEIARDYLDFYFPTRLRATRRQAATLRLHRSAPIYCRPGVYERHCYIDIKSAFFSIMGLAGWDVDYFPDRWIRPGYRPVDFPYPGHKVARNALVSAGLPTPMRMWTGKTMVKRRNLNVHINLSLWALIMDTLNCIAQEAIACEAVYVHTDGAIVPSYRAADFIEAVQSYALLASIKPDSVGRCVMLGMGNWRCGERRTKLFGRASSMGGCDHIYYANPSLIKRKFQKFARLITP